MQLTVGGGSGDTGCIGRQRFSVAYLKIVGMGDAEQRGGQG